jgi:hypothetical protein
MSVLNVQIGQVGLSGIDPQIIYIATNDTLSEVTVSGYLNEINNQNFPLTNRYISSTSQVMLTLSGGTNTNQNITLQLVPGSETATLTIYNNSADTPLNGTVLISYSIT